MTKKAKMTSAGRAIQKEKNKKFSIFLFQFFLKSFEKVFLSTFLNNLFEIRSLQNALKRGGIQENTNMNHI